MPDPRHTPEQDSLPEHIAQRVIARAIELDTDGATRMPVARLRDIAQEAGISSQSLERALAEAFAGAPAPVARVERAGYFHRLGRRLRGRITARDLEAEPELWTLRGAVEALTTNLLAFAMFWVPALVLNVGARRLGFLWGEPDSTIGVLVCTLAGIALARRMRARGNQAFLSVMAIAMTVSVIAEITSSSRTVGFFGSSAFLWMVAAVLGIGVGLLVARTWFGVGRGRGGAHPVTTEDESAAMDRADATPMRGPFLRLGIQRA